MDKPKQRKQRIMKHNLAIQHYQAVSGAYRGRCSIDGRIRAFINGESHGEDVLRALYGDIADEPVPERLSALLKR